MTTLSGTPDFQEFVGAQPAYDLLDSQTGVSLHPSFANTITLPSSYEGIRVTVAPSVAGQLLVVVQNNTSIPYKQQTYNQAPATPPVAVFDFAMLNEVSDSFTYTIASQQNPITGNVTVWGIRKLSFPCRTDGRPYPVGQFFYSLDTNVNNTPLVAAPGGNTRIMLLAVFMSCTGSPIGTEIQLEGTFTNLVRLDVNGAVASLVFPAGLLLDPGTGMSTANVGANPGAFSGVYDIVY